MSKHAPRRHAKNVRLANALKELGHALLAIYPDTEGAVLVVSLPDPFEPLSLPVVAPESGLPEPEGE